MDNILSKKIGGNINNLLAVQNKKQNELAKALGVTDNTVSYFCNGNRMPNTEQIIKIAKYFNVSSDYLLGLSNVASKDIAKEELQSKINYLNNEISKIYSFLNEEKQEST